MLMDLAHLVCATSNPFCAAAKGAKLTDSDTSPSITYRVSQLVPITTDANGYQAMMIGASPASAYFLATTITAGTVAVWGSGNNNSFYSQLSNNIVKWRVVSAGVRIRTTQAWTAATGYYTLSEVSNLSTTQLPDCGATTYGLRAEMIPLRDANVAAIMRPQGKVAEDYQSISTTAYTHTAFLLTTSGATASTTVGQIELIVNYEYVPTEVSGFQQFTSPAGRNIPSVSTARANVMSSHQLVIEGAGSPADDRSWMAKAADALNGVATAAVPALNAYNSMSPETKTMVLRGGKTAAGLLMM